MSRFEVDIPLRWGDMDAQGHVNNGVYADYMQEARVEFLRAGQQTALMDSGVVVVGHQVEYLAPIQFSPTPVRIAVEILSVGAAKFQVGYEISHEGVLRARATSTACPFDLLTQRPRRLNDAERTLFESHIEADSGFAPFRELTAPALTGRGHRHPVRVRWSDVDRYNHVNNVRLFDYIQEARIAMTTQADPGMARQGTAPQVMAPPAPGDPNAMMWLVARQDVDYVGQLGFRREPYQVISAVTRLGTSSATFSAEVVDPLRGDAVLARGRTVLVSADPQGHPIPLPDHVRAALTPGLVTTA